MTINPYIEVTFDVEFFIGRLHHSRYYTLLMTNQNFMGLEFRNTETGNKQLRFIFNNINPERDFNIQPKGDTIKITFKRKYNPLLISVNIGSTTDTFNFQ
jgi:hypothetical protein